jgi:hypothetical protein
MASGPEDNESILRAYLQLVSEQRGVPLGQSILLRRRDVAVLADFLDLDDDALEGKLAAILKLSTQEASDLGGQLRRHRVAVAAVGVGMLAAVPFAGDRAGASNITSTFPREAMIGAPAITHPSERADAPLDVDALARMDALVAATPAVVVPRSEWPRRRRAAVPAMAPALGVDRGVEIGDALVLER